MINKREMLPVLFTTLNFKVGVEVGVQTGKFSQVIVNNWPGKLYLVDCWEHQGEKYTDDSNKSDREHSMFHRMVVEKFKEFDRVHILKSYSLDAVFLIEEELDFVYLDANHSKDAVAEDLKAWYPKIKSGGMFCGHDYLNANNRWGQFGVKSAVDEFAAEHSIVVQQTDEKWPSWFFIKPFEKI